MKEENFNPDDEDLELDELVKHIQKSLSHFLEFMQKQEKNDIDYMEKEGFIEKTDIPGMYQYTPEGFALIHEQYKKHKKNGH